jgi:hypothetical protein
MRASITCKLTGTIGTGVRAHIIPESFYDLGGEKQEPARIITPGKNPLVIRSPAGEYDAGIVTAEGEAYFSSWDSYAYEILLGRERLAKPYILGGELAYVEIDKFDYSKLKLFFISLLWRAGVPTRPFFQLVNLGPHEARLRQLILDKNPGSEQDYSVMLGIHSDTPPYGFPMVAPHLIKDNEAGVNYYKFSLGRLIACIKVDARPFGASWVDAVVSPHLPLRFIILDEFRSSDFYKEMRQRTRAAHYKRKQH